MRILWRERLGFSCRIADIALVLLFTAVICSAADQQPTQDLPVVIDAKVPSYPNIARLAHFEGVVRLQVSTDGEKVSKVELLEGHIVLAGAAMENVKTWRFRWHTRATFETVFRYRLLPESVCEADNPTVLLRLPLEVEVTTKGMTTCDPSSEIRPK